MLDVASLGDSLRVWSFDWHGGFGMYFAVFFVKFSVRLIFFFVFVCSCKFFFRPVLTITSGNLHSLLETTTCS